MQYFGNQPQRKHVNSSAHLRSHPLNQRNCHPDSEFRCLSEPHKCIPVSRLCDMILDCPDRSDETTCYDYGATYQNDAEHDHFGNLRHKKDGSTPTVVSAIPIGFAVHHRHDLRHPVPNIGLFVELHLTHVTHALTHNHTHTFKQLQITDRLARAFTKTPIYQTHTLYRLYCYAAGGKIIWTRKATRVFIIFYLPVSIVYAHYHFDISLRLLQLNTTVGGHERQNEL